MSWRPFVAALGIVLAGCAAERLPPSPSGEVLAYEPAPVPRIRQEAVPGRFAAPLARREHGWADRWSGTPAGAPYRPRF